MIELSPEQKAGIFLASGDAHPELSAGIASEMGMELGGVALKWHPNTEPYVRYEENLRDHQTIIIQPHAPNADGRSVNDAFRQHLEMIDAAVRASSGPITAVATNLAGARQDRQAQERESVSIAVTLKALEMAGATNVVTVDLHTPQSLPIFRGGAAEHIPAQPVMQRAIEDEIEGDRDGFVLVAPDVGRAKMLEEYGDEMQLGVVNMTKTRSSDNGSVSYPSRVDNVDGLTCIVVDDMIDTAGTIVEAAEVLKNSGAKRIITAATHGWFSDPAIERLNDSPIDRIIVSDTIPLIDAQDGLGGKLKVVSVAGIVADVLSQIATGGSVAGAIERHQQMAQAARKS